MTRKSIFVTGAGSGIGRATAQYFAARGWFVGLTDIDPKGLAETEKTIPEDRRMSAPLDVRDPAQWRGALGAFGAHTGATLDVLFNNAGLARHGWFEDVPEDQAVLTVDVNLKGVINGVYAALPLLKAARGRVINVSSAAGLYGTPRLAVYSATKFAVRGLTEALDVELSRHGVRAVCLMPWFVESPLLDVTTSGSNSTMRDTLDETPVYPTSAAAEGAWEAAHTDKAHVYVGKASRDFGFAARFFPNAVRRRLKKMNFAQG